MGRFLLKRKAEGIVYYLKAANGEVIASSGVYSTEAACMKGIASAVKNAAIAGIEDQTAPRKEAIKHPKYEIFKDETGLFRFRLKARNGEVILVSDSYKAKASCMNGINSVKKNVVDAKIEKML